MSAKSANASVKKGTNDQRTPWGGGKGRGVENLTNDTPPKKGFWTPLVRYVFHPPHVSVLCFSCTEIHDRADQKLFWRGPKIFGRACSLVRFPPPIRFAPPHITAQNERKRAPPCRICKQPALGTQSTGGKFPPKVTKFTKQ